MIFTDADHTISFLRRKGLAAEKSLGQHFLTDRSVVDAMISELDGSASVLEIGPGPGILTGALDEGFRTTAVEIDARMIPILAEVAPNTEVHNLDALQTDLRSLLTPLPEPRALVSNIPYYITAPLLQKFAPLRSDLTKMVLMMQKEVGDRILAKPGNSDRGSLSVWLQSLFTIRKLVDVPQGAFYPPPKVRSIVLIFEPRIGGEIEGLEALLKVAFKMPRKTLANNLAQRYFKEQISQRLQSLELQPQIRPHELTEEHWRAWLSHDRK